GGGDDGCSRARGGPLTLLPGPLARLAAREGEPGGGRGKDRRAGRRGHRAPRAVRRAVPVQEEQGQAGTGEADADPAARAGTLERRGGARATDAEQPLTWLRLPETGSQRPYGGRGRRARDRRGREGSPHRRVVRARARRARGPR